MQKIAELTDKELLNLGKITANSMIDLMIAHKNHNYKNESINIRISECDLESEKNSWIQFQLRMQSNPLLFIKEEIEIGYIPKYKEREINLDVFESSLKILDLCEVNDIPVEIANVIINQFEKTINKIINP
jgi:hypothetical protein